MANGEMLEAARLLLRPEVITVWASLCAAHDVRHYLFGRRGVPMYVLGGVKTGRERVGNWALGAAAIRASS